MREIKFRGRVKSLPGTTIVGLEGTWVFGDLETHGRKGRTIMHFYDNDAKRYREYDVDPNTVGQFTGLYDEDKREIYEGDIVMNGAVVYEVQYSCGDDGFTGWALVNEDNAKFYCNQKMMSLSKVVGNIHDKAAGYTCADCGFFNEWDQHCDNPEVNLDTAKEAAICQHFKHK